MDRNDPFDLGRLMLTFGVMQRLSAAGRMLDQLDSAERRLESEGIDDELHAALRRADILSRREMQ